MSIKQKGTRVGAFLLAILFLATSVGFSAVVLLQVFKGDKKDNTPISDQTNQAEEQTMQEDTNRKLANFTPTSAVDKLQTVDLVVGDGAEAKPDSTVTAHYTGATAKDGTIFESSKDSGEPATFPLAQVIKGWQEGVPGMKIGGTRRLIIPADLAYGSNGAPPKIGPNEPLVFDIELIAIK